MILEKIETPSSGFSTRLVRKGALIEETYLAFRAWDITMSVRENLDAIRRTNSIGAKNNGWLREIVVTLSSRFSRVADIQPLVHLAQKGFPVEKWKHCLLWHIGPADNLYFAFATNWLIEQHRRGVQSLRTEDVVPFVRDITHGQAKGGGDLSQYGLVRAGRDLLRMASDFELLTTGTIKHFTSHHLPEDCFLYVCHGIFDREANPFRVVNSKDWHLFLMTARDVEQELFRLHQFKKVHYEVAGSLSQLTLPCKSLMEYAQEMTA